MVSEPSFKFRGSKAYIGFGFAGRRHLQLGLINNSFREAISFQGAFFLLPTVACSFGLALCRLCRVLRNSLVVSLYNLLYVRLLAALRVACEQQTYFRSFLQKITSAISSCETNSVTPFLFFFTRPMKLSDRKVLLITRAKSRGPKTASEAA